MTESTGQQGRAGRQGHPCPECGALRAADNTPSCSCARRASEALRDAREAEAAAAEDFDPLRIRPYVEIGGAGERGGDGGPAPEAAAADVTMPLPPVPGAAPSASRASGAGGPAPADPDATAPVPPVPDAAAPVPQASDVTVPLRAVDPSGPDPRTTALPTPLGTDPSEPSAADLSLFETGEPGGGGAYADDGRPRGRRRRALLIASAAAAVAVVAAAGFASGLFSYEKPSRDGAAPEDVRAAVPDTSTSAPSASAPASPSASPSASSASPSPSESESASPSPSASSASPTASPTTGASPSAPTAQASGSPAPGNGTGPAEVSPEAPVLRRGDQGAEVTELQLRLRQLYLYNDEADGVFTNRVESALRNYQWSRGIQGDELGVYGAATRERLESETKEP